MKCFYKSLLVAIILASFCIPCYSESDMEGFGGFEANMDDGMNTNPAQEEDSGGYADSDADDDNSWDHGSGELDTDSGDDMRDSNAGELDTEFYDNGASDQGSGSLD